MGSEIISTDLLTHRSILFMGPTIGPEFGVEYEVMATLKKLKLSLAREKVGARGL